jgi:hypothetical protein
MIKGRVVPIYNKKRIGEITEKYSARAVGAGAAITAAGLMKTRARKKTSAFLAKRGIKSKDLKFTFNQNSGFSKMMNKRPKTKFIAKSLAKVSKGAVKAAFSKRVGLGLLGAGLVGTEVGIELQARSPFGYDVGAGVKTGNK